MTTALVTGASGGIGEEFARVLAEHHHDLILVARSTGKLEALAEELREKHNVAATVIAQDLSEPGAAAELMAELDRRGLTLDILINNAGFGLRGPFVDLPADRQHDMLELNVVVLTDLTHLALERMRPRGSGRILNVASTAAFQPGPMMAVYYASKAYVLSFTEALANELEGSGITATALCPGPTTSGFQVVAGTAGSRLNKRNVMSARRVAEEGYGALMAGKAVRIPGFGNEALAFSVRLAPRSVVTKITRSLNN